MSDIQGALSIVNDFLSEWDGLVIGIASVTVSLIVFFYSRRRNKFNSLFEVQKYLNEDRHREARRVLNTKDDPKVKAEDRALSSHIILGFDAIAKGYPLHRVCEDIVRDDMDHLGILLKAKLVPENESLGRYCVTILKSRVELTHNIKKRREKRHYKDYLNTIDYLVIRALNFYIKYAEETKDDEAVKYLEQFAKDTKADREIQEYLKKYLGNKKERPMDNKND